jgi:hypothetical protein
MFHCTCYGNGIFVDENTIFDNSYAFFWDADGASGGVYSSKIANNGWYKTYTLQDLLSTDYPEIVDTTLREKMALQDG